MKLPPYPKYSGFIKGKTQIPHGFPFAPPTTFESLPLDMYSQISKKLGSSDQPAFRRLTTQTYKSNYATKHCFQDISPWEIARFILKQQQLLKQDIANRKSKLLNYAGSWPNTRSTVSLHIVSFGFNFNTGEYWESCKAHNLTEEYIVDKINEAQEKRYTYFKNDEHKSQFNAGIDFRNPENNWNFTMDIIKERISCLNPPYNLTAHQIFIRMFADRYPYKLPSHKLDSFVKSILLLKSILSDIGKTSFITHILQKFGLEDFSKVFTAHYESDIYYDLRKKFGKFIDMKIIPVDINIENYNTAVRHWLLSLQPADLKFDL